MKTSSALLFKCSFMYLTGSSCSTGEARSRLALFPAVSVWAPEQGLRRSCSAQALALRRGAVQAGWKPCAQHCTVNVSLLDRWGAPPVLISLFPNSESAYSEMFKTHSPNANKTLGSRLPAMGAVTLSELLFSF